MPSIAQQEASLGIPEGPNCTGATSKSLRWCRTVLPGPGPLRQAIRRALSNTRSVQDAPAAWPHLALVAHFDGEGPWIGSTSCQRPKLPPPQAAQHLPDPAHRPAPRW